MSVFLLLLGAVTAATGLALVASGVTIHDGAFDTEVITPGTIAAVGGLLLVGMGLAVRELQRIERALAARPTLRLARAGEAPVAAAAEAPNAPVRIPFPPKPKTNSNAQPASPGANAAPGTAEDGAFERLRTKFPTLARLENGPVVEGTDVSLMPRAPARAEEDVGEVKSTAAVGGRANGGAPARAAPRLDAKARAAASPDRAKGSVFNAFWPVGPRRDTPTAPAPVASSPPPPSIEPAAPVSEAAPDLHPAAGEPAAPAPVSVLKSGVVEGMAYTLYSDGSIEAQLPQGTLRFGSITALRNHIESSS